MKSRVVLRTATHSAGLGSCGRGRVYAVVSQQGQCPVDGLAFSQEEADGLLAQGLGLIDDLAHI
ncbi:MAG: hypothetical protein ABSC02_10315 [Acidobacteriota bacterium]